MNEDSIYVVTKDMDGMGREENICVTDDPDRAKRVCDEEYEEDDAAIGKQKYHTFIEVWSMHAEEPKYTTREHPDTLE